MIFYALFKLGYLFVQVWYRPLVYCPFRISQPVNELLAIHLDHIPPVVIVTLAEESITAFTLRVYVFLTQRMKAVGSTDKVTAIHLFVVPNYAARDALHIPIFVCGFHAY